MVLEIGDGCCSRKTITEIVPALRRRVISSPLVLRHANQNPSDHRELAFWAAKLGARALLTAGDAPEAALRKALTDPIDLGSDLLDWLEICGYVVNVDSRTVIASAFRDPLRLGGVLSLLDDAGVALSRARARLRAAGLANPSAWVGLSRALNAALHLQRTLASLDQRLAIELGYSEPAAVTHAFRNYFGMTPVMARAWIGWESLVWRWLISRAKVDRTC